MLCKIESLWLFTVYINIISKVFCAIVVLEFEDNYIILMSNRQFVYGQKSLRQSRNVMTKDAFLWNFFLSNKNWRGRYNGMTFVTAEARTTKLFTTVIFAVS